MRDPDGMSILVTGGGSGIGAGTAAHLVQRGARVTIAGRRASKLEGVAEGLGDACLPVAADVTEAADRVRLVEAAVTHGGGLDAVVHGAANMYRGQIEELAEDQLTAVFASNVIGPLLLTGLCTPHLEARQGAVIFFGSVHTTRAFPGASPYAGTKGALETATGVLAAELGGRNIRVSCVRPGAVFTEINVRAGIADPDQALERLESLGPAHALGRIGAVEEIAEAVAYLIGAEWTTGAVMVVDGGLGLGVTDA
ncbi:SDR family NAD(P)-dependent oxidoreductase [Euzebya tangerina]|uniref:SDR family NAD(P)-dependent oxidoreductase n=1 Tax=Euzebya tangerina TaxID=591198 RepID=UPI00196B19F7|nr:SDR family oxidoreductase [Euzebya tangerina]